MAFLGDAIYEVYIRKYLLSKGITKIGELQKESIKFVSANGQRQILERIIDNNYLTNEEIEIVKWGRNAKGPRSKKKDIISYRLATGLEALIGYLSINKQEQRIEEIMNYILGDNDDC